MSSRPKRKTIQRDRGPAPSVQQMMASPAPQFVALGKTWRMDFNRQDAKGRLEQLVAGHVWEHAYKTADSMSPELSDRHLERVQKQFDKGHYATLSTGWQEVIGTADGVILFILSLLQEHHPDLTAAEARAVFADNPREVKRALQVIAPDFFKAVLRQMGAPEAAMREHEDKIDSMIGSLTSEEESIKEPESVSA